MRRARKYYCIHILLLIWCNHVFIFDKTQYMELSNEGIETVYYCPLAVNTDRLSKSDVF
ncbi:MAG: DUF3880 domain-containing protein [Lachnospira eligens]